MALFFNHFPIVLRLFLAFSLTTVLYFSNAQGFLEQYPNTLHSNSANILDRTGSGDYIMMGLRPNPSLDSFYYHVVRSNSSGKFINLQSVQTPNNIYPANGRQWYVRKVLEDANGNPSVYAGIHFERLNADFQPLWSTELIPVNGEQFDISHVAYGADGATWIAGVHVSAAGIYQVKIFKFSSTGTLVWEKTFSVGNPQAGNGQKLITTDDGGIIYAFYDLPPYTSILKLNADGQQEWRVTGGLENWLSVDESSNALLISRDTITAHSSGLIGQIATLRKINPGGAVLWTRLLRDPEQTYFALPDQVLTAENGDFVVLGTVSNHPSDPITIFFQRITANGDLAVHREYDFFLPQTPYFQAGLAENEGLFTFLGYRNGFILWQLNENGDFVSNFAAGSIRLDENSNCIAENSEASLPYRIATVRIGNQKFYGQADAFGAYHIPLPEGPYNAVAYAQPLNYLWDPCFPSGQALSMPDTTSLTLNLDLPTKPWLYCPHMQVHVSSSTLLACAANNISVQVCNEGTAAAQQVEVDLTSLSEVTFDTALISHIVLGDTVRAFVGTLEAGACSTFTAIYTMPCDPGALVCLQAHVRPDQFCGEAANWSGASLEARANCAPDSVRFTLQNKGTQATTEALDFIVVEDMVVMHQGLIPAGFSPGQHMGYTVPNNGKLYRIIADQEANHPVQGAVSVAAPDCAFGFSPAQYLQFPDEDGSPFSSTMCRELQNNIPPMQAQAYPLGLGSNQDILPHTPIQYRFDFRNTTSQPISSITLVDSLSAWYNPASLRLLGASHPFSSDFLNSNQLAFRFEKIMLQPGENLHLSFSLSPDPLAPLGAMLHQAGKVYADLAPVTALHPVFHTIKAPLLSAASSTPSLYQRQVQYALTPNPAAENCVLYRYGAAGQGAPVLRLSNQQGLVVSEQLMQENSILIQRNQLPSGLYWLSIFESGQSTRVLKLIWD